MEHAGHRRRMIEKLKTDSLLEHELLEVLLFNALPRRNTNDLAHKLLGEFGSVKEILSAPIEQLTKVEGVGESVAAYLVCVGKLMSEYASEFCDPRLRVTDRSRFWRFLKKEYAKLAVEVFDVYLVDRDGCVFYKHRFTENSADAVQIEPTSFSKLLVDFSPSGVVCVHNHPSGEAMPSQADEAATQKMQMLCGINNVLFCDHIIYAAAGIYSYYLSGKLEEISEEFNTMLFPYGKGGENEGTKE